MYFTYNRTWNLLLRTTDFLQKMFYNINYRLATYASMFEPFKLLTESS